ncbi:MAG TPA: WG repeat-containing protein [Allosphingosinicella sp.]|nr:WG repeat-containing protein [Allosphingosinicella sp.]
MPPAPAAVARDGASGPAEPPRRRWLIAAAALAAFAAAGAGWWWLVRGPPAEPAEVGSVDTSLIPVAVNGRCGFARSDGAMEIEPRFEDAGFFLASSGLAPAKLDGKWGLVDRGGRFAVRPQFDDLLGFSTEGLAAVRVGDRWGLIDSRGGWAMEPRFQAIGHSPAGDEPYFPEGLMPAGLSDRTVYVNRAGAVQELRPLFRPYGSFSSGLAPVWVNLSLGYVDRSGQQVVAPEFTSAGAFTGAGLAPVSVQGWANREGYIDRTGAVRIPPRFATARPFASGPLGWTAAVAVAGQGWGLIDQQGAFKIEPRFSCLRDFDGNGRAVACTGQTLGLIDSTGNYVVQPVYDHLQPLSGSGSYFFARLRDASGQSDVGLIDSNGRTLASAPGMLCARSAAR